MTLVTFFAVQLPGCPAPAASVSFRAEWREISADPARGLNGVCDFLISEDYHQTFVSSPVLVVVEAKNENITGGYAQCIATMLAARLFNEQEQKPYDTIYGAVTTGNQWKFLKLEADTAYIDVREYYIEHVDVVMGILCTMIRVR